MRLTFSAALSSLDANAGASRTSTPGSRAGRRASTLTHERRASVAASAPSRALRHVVVSALVALGVCSAGCSKSEQPPAAGSEQRSERPAPAEPVHVRIGYQKIGSPFLLKERAESLNKSLAESSASVEWIEFQAGPPILEAMRGNAVDIGYVGETPPVFAQAGGVPFVYVATDPPAPASEAILVHADSPIRELAQLKGKKVALNRGSNVHWLLFRALEHAHLALTDIEVLFLSPADARSAFDSHKVDAWVIWDPFQAAAELAGARVLKDGTELVQNRFFYVARRAFAEEHPELVSKVLAEFSTLSGWAGTHAPEASTLLAKSSGIAHDALLTSEKRHAYGLSPITPDVVDNQQRIADAFAAQHVIPKTIKITDALPPRQLYGDAR
jgi:sulfonate transport system substrate-binding protein